MITKSNDAIRMQVFKDPVQDEQFKEDGFVVIENLLTPEEVRLLAEFYASNPLPQASGFHATSHSKDVNYKRKVHEIITSVVRPKTTDILIDHRSVTSSFTVKFSFANHRKMHGYRICRKQYMIKTHPTLSTHVR